MDGLDERRLSWIGLELVTQAGDVLTSTGSGFLPNEPVHLQLDAPNGSLTAVDFGVDNAGGFTYPLRVPPTGSWKPKRAGLYV